MKYLMESLYSPFLPVFEVQYNVQENKAKESLENKLKESNILNVIHYLNKK